MFAQTLPFPADGRRNPRITGDNMRNHDWRALECVLLRFWNRGTREIAAGSIRGSQDLSLRIAHIHLVAARLCFRRRTFHRCGRKKSAS